MAIRQLKGRAKGWLVYWRNPHTGKQESKAFSTKQEAKKEESLIKHRLLFERDSFDKGIEQPETITLEQVYVLYIKEKQFSKEALKNQMYGLRDIFKRIGSYPIDRIDKALIQETMDAVRVTGIKPVTVHGRFSLLRAILRWGANKGLYEMMPFPPLPSCHYEKFIPPTQKELLELLRCAVSHIRRVIILGSQLGVRIGQCELFSMKWADIDLSERVVHVQGSHKNPNAPWREVPIRDSLYPIMEKWYKMDSAQGIEYVIHFEGKPVQSIKTAWRATLKRAGITRRIRPYDLRHAFATEAIAAGIDIGTVAELMGHSSPEMILRHYQYVASKQKRIAVESLPELSCMSTSV